MSTRSTAGGRALRRMGDHLLTLLAVGGALCILLVILSWAFSITIMMFRTGSMSPTITAGSIAFVREIPAVEMEEGDVVTVDRGENDLPVTHRVVEIREQDLATGEVTFVMRGDANEAEDPEPYTATEVRRVLFAVPGAAKVIQLLGDPRVLGALTVGATLLVVWAFWPRSGDRSDDDEDTDGDDALSDPSPHQAPTRQALTLPVLAALVLAAPAAGETETVLITGEHLRLQTEGDPAQMQNLAPGESALWEVGIWAQAPDPGEIHIGLAGRGDLATTPGALSVSVDSCAAPWAEDSCAPGAESLLRNVPLDQLGTPSATHHLATFAADHERWLRISVTLSESAGNDMAGAGGDVLVEAVGGGEQLSTGDPSTPPGADGGYGGGDGGGDLARTGAAGTLQAALAASILLIAGTVLLRSRRR